MNHVACRTVDFPGSLAEQLIDSSLRPLPGELVLYWLGQAGFVIEFGAYRLLLDPYLSDSLARKYAGTRYTHRRMMAAPILPEQFTRLDLVLCTHRHTDHMDPDTLRPLAAAFPDLRFVVPAASTDEACQRCGVGMNRLIPLDTGDWIEPLPQLRITALAAAHESFSIDANGHHEWLGYVMDFGGLRIYHSGDGIPYPGLADTLADLAPQVALLPVNGRDAERSGNGVPGNFTLDEAITLCHDAGVTTMIAHHYGLFEFNTVSPETIDARSAIEASGDLALFRARLGTAFKIGTTRAGP